MDRKGDTSRADTISRILPLVCFLVTYLATVLHVFCSYIVPAGKQFVSCDAFFCKLL